MILLSLFLFLFVILFSFAVLIPSGKEYRVKRLENKKLYRELRSYENFHNETQEKLQELRSSKRAIITAFKRTFNPLRFEKQNKSYFSSLSIREISFSKTEGKFALYEVNTTSQISSPKNFYHFLDALNKSDWIIGVNFPIIFKREGELIKSSFTMQVYANSSDSNSTASLSVAK